MAFEYDPAKSAANKDKRGIDFEEAQRLWDDPRMVEAALVGVEPRMLVVGRIGGKHWTAVCTERGGNVRIISVRRERKKEVERHEQDCGA